MRWEVPAWDEKLMSTVLTDFNGPIATITFNRPDKLNAINPDLLAELSLAFDEIERRVDIRVVVLRGAGRAFSVGMDIDGKKYDPNLTVFEDHGDLKNLIRLSLRMWEFPKPIVAQVHGYCCAAATMLAGVCDITIVSSDCKIRWPSIPLGGGLVSSFWTFFASPKKVKEMEFAAGGEMTGEESVLFGWATRAVPAEDVEATTAELVARISRTPPDLLYFKKQAINRVMEAQGFRTILLGGVEWDTLAHFSPGTQAIRQQIREQGMKETIKSFHSGASPAKSRR